MDCCPWIPFNNQDNADVIIAKKKKCLTYTIITLITRTSSETKPWFWGPCRQSRALWTDRTALAHHSLHLAGGELTSGYAQTFGCPRVQQWRHGNSLWLWDEHKHVQKDYHLNRSKKTCRFLALQTDIGHFRFENMLNFQILKVESIIKLDYYHIALLK